MKIDNKGWGLNTMLIMVGIILIALLAVTFFSIRLNNLLGNENNESENKIQNAINDSYYTNKVSEISSAMGRYINDMDISLSSTPISIDINTLISHDYLTPITDYISNNRCSGYSVAYLNNGNIRIINSYIKCDNYTSKGYGEK
ncbi:MAG: hypothetical protein IJ572_02660 [Bacilli bacterium]|nr:hypothetical protein [Bacilli bacterium]